MNLLLTVLVFSIIATLLTHFAFAASAAVGIDALNATHDVLLDTELRRVVASNNLSTVVSSTPWATTVGSAAQLVETKLYISRFGGPLTAITTAVSLSATSPSQFYADVVGVEPLCMTYNVQNTTAKLSVTLSALSQILTGAAAGQVREVGSGGSTVPFANSSAFSVYIPSASSADGGLVKAFLLSMAAGGAPVAAVGNADYSAAILANGGVAVLQSEALVAAAVASSSVYALGLVGLKAAVAAGLTCLRVAVPQPSSSSTPLFTAAMSRTALPLYTINTTALTVVVASASAMCYPLVAPIVVFLNSSAICSLSTTDATALGGAMNTALSIIDSLASDEASASFFRSNLATLARTSLYAVMQQARVSLSHCASAARLANPSLVTGVSATTWVATGGSSALQPVVVPWLLKYRETNSAAGIENLFVSYNPAGSGFGLSAAASGAVVMGGSEDSLTAPYLAQRSSLINVPVIGLAIALILRFPDTCAQVLLPRCVIPLIFRGNVSMWDDEQLAAANPLMTLPHVPIQVVVRSGSSGSTGVLTSGLAKLEAACGIANPVFYESPVWVFGSQVTVVSSAAQSSFVRTNLYTLSYIAYSTAVQDGHQLATVFDSDSQLTTSPQVTSAKLASYASINDSSLVVSFPASASFYPFVGVTYAILDTDRAENCSEFAYIANFLLWAMSDPVPLALADDLNYISIPSTIAKQMAGILMDRLTCGGKLLFPKPVTSSNTAAIVAGVVVPCVVLLIGFFMWMACFSGKRNNSAAPKDATKPVAMVFTDIQASTTLWASVPTVMARALDLHNSTLRACLARNNGYEVKTIGDAFMIAFASVEDAVTFSLEAQQDLYDADWATDEIDMVYEDMADANGLVTIQELWNGLRVRIGVHCGLLDIHLDPVTQGYDYHGNVVNTTARVEDAGHGGQVVVTQDVLDALPSGFMSKHQTEVKDIGPTELRGLLQPVVLTQLLPKAFVGRTFPPLRVEKESALLDDEDQTLTDGGTEASNNTAHISAMLVKVFPVAATVDVLFSAMAPDDSLPIVRKISKSWGLHISKKATDVNVFYRRLAVRCSEVLSVRSDRMRRGSRMTATDCVSVVSAATTKVDQMFSRVAAKYEFKADVSEDGDEAMHVPRHR